MSRETVTALLTFLALVITLASQTLPISPDLQPWLAFFVLVINGALSIFFGVNAVKNRAARLAAEKAR